MTGEVSADGSPVAAYAALPAEPELSVVRGLLRGRTSVLDLGCGTGRIADPLAQDGHDVAAVDESDAMLHRVRYARTVRSPIEQLDLGRTFDAVLLLSHLVNSANVNDILDAAARHLVDGGLLIAQRLEPGRPWRSGSSQVGPVTIGLDDLTVDGPRIEGTTTYSVDGRTWRQPWVMWERTDEELRRLLADAGLQLTSAEGVWVQAVRNA